MPTIAQIEKFVGMPYDAQSFDCGDLAVRLQADLFGKAVALPGHRHRNQTQAASISRYRQELADPIAIEGLHDGDVVIMKGESLHIGTTFKMAGSWRVLHNSRTLGHVVLHKLSDLAAFGLRIEGFYRWK